MKFYILLGLVLGCVGLPLHKNPQHYQHLRHLLTTSLSHTTTTTTDPSAPCNACKSTVGVLHLLMKAGKGIEVLEKVASFICQRFTTQRVCNNGVRVFAGDVWQFLAAGFVTPEEICGLVFGKVCGQQLHMFPSWNVTIPPPTKHTPTSSSTGVKTGTGKPKKVLHLTDTHLDEDYREGSLAVCDEPLCCRRNDGLAKKGEPAAGKYGYPGFCDTNYVTLHALFQHVKAHHKDIDYVLWTGDVPSHDVWNQTKTSQTSAIKQAAAFLKTYFPNIKVFPTLGNHESVPVNFFPPPELWDWSITGTQWLYDVSASVWGEWLPQECQETIKKGGYYTTLVEKGLRVVSLNTNFGHKENIWLAIMSEDPAKQLQWLVQVLLDAEKAGERVHIIGHVPPGLKLHWWSFNYYRIVDRFRHTITGQFYGHTHHDEFRIFYDLKTFKQPINYAYVGPSVTTYHDLNPGYRIYEIDAGTANSSFSVIDHYTYILDLDKAMRNGETTADFELEYSARNAFKLPDMSPRAWNDLIGRMHADDALFQVFYRAFTKQHVVEPCHFGCRVRYLCAMKTALSDGHHDFCDMDMKEKAMFQMWKARTYNKC